MKFVALIEGRGVTCGHTDDVLDCTKTWREFESTTVHVALKKCTTWYEDYTLHTEVIDIKLYVVFEDILQHINLKGMVEAHKKRLLENMS